MSIKIDQVMTQGKQFMEQVDLVDKESARIGRREKKLKAKKKEKERELMGSESESEDNGSRDDGFKEENDGLKNSGQRKRKLMEVDVSVSLPLLTVRELTRDQQRKKKRELKEQLDLLDLGNQEELALQFLSGKI